MPKHFHWLCNIAIQLISDIALSTPIVANEVLAHCSTNKKQCPVRKNLKVSNDFKISRA